MTDTSGPQHDEPQNPRTPAPAPASAEATRPLPKAEPTAAGGTAAGSTYPPGFEPGGPSDPSKGAVPEPVVVVESAVTAVPGIKGHLARLPMLAGVAGGALVALLGFGGGFVVGHATAADGDGDRGQVALRGGDRAEFGGGVPGGRTDRDGGTLPGAPVPSAPGADATGAST